MSEPTVLVLGASGNVGSALTRRLATRGAGVRAFHAPGEAPAFPDGVQAFAGDLGDTAALRRAMDGADAVFLLTPPSPEQVVWQRTVVRLVDELGVPRVVKLSAFDTGADSPLHMGRWHHDGELALARSRAAWVVLRPQYFMQMLTAPLRAALTSGVMAGTAAPDLRLGVVHADDIAAVAEVVLTRPGHEGQVLVPTGPQALSFTELAEAFAVLAGRPIRYAQRPADDVVRGLAERGLPDWHVEDVLLIHGAAASPQVTDDVQRVTGVAPRSFADFAREEVLAPAGT